MPQTPRGKRSRGGEDSARRCTRARTARSATSLGPAATTDGERNDGDGSRSRRDGSNDHTIYVSPQPQPVPGHSSPSPCPSMQVSSQASSCNSPAPGAACAYKGGAGQNHSSPTPIDLTNEEVGQEDAALRSTPTLPFSQQDLARFTSTSGVEQWLNDGIINTFFEYVVALNENLSTASSGIWVVPRTSAKKLACTKSTIFLLPVNRESKHWVCLGIYVEQRVAEMFDSLPNPEYDKTCSELASDFITKWLPKPFSDWDKWHIKRPRHSPQQPNSHDCGVFIIGVALYIALRKEVPPSFDNQFLRSFIHTLGANINYATARRTIVSPDKNENQPAISDLSNLRFSNSLPPQCIPEYRSQVPGLPLDHNTVTDVFSASTLESFATCEKALFDYAAQSRVVVNSYIDAKISQLRRLEAAANEFAILAEALCAAGQSMETKMERLERDESVVMNIKRACTELVIIENERMVTSADESLAVIRREKAGAKRLILLKSAVEMAEVPTVLKHLEETRAKYLRHHAVHDECSILEEDGERSGEVEPE